MYFHPAEAVWERPMPRVEIIEKGVRRPPFD
jgi:hypothetical protein